MFSLLQQVQYACFIPVDFARHFSDVPPPRVGYDEASFADLKASLKQTIAYLRAITPKQFAERGAPLLPLFFDSARGLDPRVPCEPVDRARLLLPCDGRLRHPPPQWRAARQG